MVIETKNREMEILRKFKAISSDQKNHEQLLKDKKSILYAATLLDNEKPAIINLCLDIFDNFIANKDSHVSLITAFGVYESLESLCIRMRNIDENIFRRASKITEIIRNAAPPAYSTRSRAKGVNNFKKQTVYLLFIPDLTPENRPHFENTLIKIKGVISFLIDIEIKRCTLRICPKVTIKEVAEKIFGKCALKCLIIRKNKEEEKEVISNLKDDQAIETSKRDYYDVVLNTPNRSYLEYPEEDFLHKSGAVTAATAEIKSKPGLLNSVVNFWNESFYW